MREITTHHTNGANRAIILEAIEGDGIEPASSYATRIHPSWPHDSKGVTQVFAFQAGPIEVVGVNGITLEVLLAIARDKLEYHQSTRYACIENAAALAFVKNAANALESRTTRRTAEGVEGTHMLDKGAREADVITPADVGSVDDLHA